MYAVYGLTNRLHALPTRLGSMKRCVRLGNVIPLVGTKGEAPKAPTILRYLKLENG